VQLLEYPSVTLSQSVGFSLFRGCCWKPKLRRLADGVCMGRVGAFFSTQSNPLYIYMYRKLETNSIQSRSDLVGGLGLNISFLVKNGFSLTIV
jgi:hypothetical protein